MPVIKRVPDFDEGKTFIVENVFVDYSSVFRPNTKYRPEWAVVIRVPQELINEFYEVGFRLKQDPNGQVTLRAKRYVRLDDGTEMAPPTVVDCENQPWPEGRGLIGNGSRCNVKVRAKYTTYQGVEGLSCFLEGLQVLDHVPYTGGTDFGTAAGSTGGWGGQNFQDTQPQQPVPAQGYQAAPAQAQPQFAPPVTPAPVQPAPAVAAMPQPVQHSQTPDNTFVPPGIPQGVPVGAPVTGNVSQPVQPAQGALGAFGQPATPAPETPAAEEPAATEYVPPAQGMGEDVPF